VQGSEVGGSGTRTFQIPEDIDRSRESPCDEYSSGSTTHESAIDKKVENCEIQTLYLKVAA
jgi:hypothetical protein